MNSPPEIPPPDAEWIETDGLGGFASGTVSGIRTRRYHALLLTATAPAAPAERMVLVNGFDAWLETDQGVFPITAQRYAPDVVSPETACELAGFELRPWPKWRYRVAGGYEIELELVVPHGASAVYLGWKLVHGPVGAIRLHVRPFFSGRGFHATHHENDAFRFDPRSGDDFLIWSPYDGVPNINVAGNGDYHHQPLWYRNFLYTQERERGLDCLEDLAAPGVFSFEVSTAKHAELAFAAGGHESILSDSLSMVKRHETGRRENFPSALHQAADTYIVRRGSGRTIIAGYPWFGDWGRDTFIAMRGLSIASQRLHEAQEILLEWAGAVVDGLLPNRFPDNDEPPEYNSVDAALWFIIAAQDYLNTAGNVNRSVQSTLRDAVIAILEGYSAGTLHGIRRDDDALLACGAPGVQLTWMDAKVDDWVVTPRIGKPVEVQALWLNALAIGARVDPRWEAFKDRGIESFREKFWNESDGALYDVIDVDHQAGKVDASICPNQIFAIGGLPLAIIRGERARRVLNTVEEQLLTPMGLRTLSPSSRVYAQHYQGDVRERDTAYHQGTVWPWLMGPFIDAWLSVNGDAPATRKEARRRFLEPFDAHLCEAGLGHISEIADGNAPHTPRGCPFQAWSIGELLRLDERLTETTLVN